MEPKDKEIMGTLFVWVSCIGFVIYHGVTHGFTIVSLYALCIIAVVLVSYHSLLIETTRRKRLEEDLELANIAARKYKESAQRLKEL